MVVFGLNSLRGCSFNFQFFANKLAHGLPSWTVIRNWILRFGLYKLLQPLPKRKDWIWIIDHTIEFGTKKCMVVLAISQEKYESLNYTLTHKDMEVAAIEIQENATGKNIYLALRKLSKQIGKPRQIVSDSCSNLQLGIRLFKRKSKKTIATYDITHKAGIEVKKLFEKKVRWTDFCNKMATTKRRVINTEFVCIAPRRPREKGRWLNLDQDIRWAEKILKNKPEKRNGRRSKLYKRFIKYFGWLDEFKEDLKKWRELLDILLIAQKEVKKNGLSQKTPEAFLKLTREPATTYLKAKELKDKLYHFFQNEVAQFPQKPITLLGTSDIIESVFGKYKIFTARTPLKEIGKSILTIPILTGEVTVKEVKQAMETISDRKLSEWTQENIGESLFAKRMKFYVQLNHQNAVKKNV